MPLQPNTIDFPLAIGLDTKTDKKLARGMLTLENGVIEKTGEVKKRPGLRKYPRTVQTINSNQAQILEGRGVYDFGGKPAILVRIQSTGSSSEADAESGWMYCVYDATLGWRPVGATEHFDYSFQLLLPGAFEGSRIYWTATGATSKHVAIAYITDAKELWIAAFTLDGTLVKRERLNASIDATPRSVHCHGMLHGGFIVVVHRATAADTIVYSFSPTSDYASQSATTAAAADRNVRSVYARSTGSALSQDAVVVAWPVATGEARLSWYYSAATDGSIGVIRDVDVAGDGVDLGGISGLGIYPAPAFGTANEPYIWIAYYFTTSDTTLRHRAYQSDGTAAAAANTIAMGSAVGISAIVLLDEFSHAGSAARGYLAAQNATEIRHFVLLSSFSTTALSTPSYLFTRSSSTGTGLATRPGGGFTPDRRNAFFLYNFIDSVESVLTATLYSMRRNVSNSALSTTSLAAVVLPDESVPLSRTNASDAHVPILLTDGRVLVPLSRRDGLPVEGAATYGIDSWGILVISQSGPAPSAVNVSGALLLSGPAVGWFDGHYQELGFLAPPEKPVLTAAAGGSLSEAAAYDFKTMWSWTDLLGIRHRSEASLGETISLSGGNDKVNIAQTAYGLAHPDFKRNAIRILVFRTEVGGSTHYQDAAVVAATSLPGTMSTQDGATTTVQTAAADATIIENEVLPEDGGELGPSVPPGAYCVFARRDRIFLIPKDRRTRLWCSKPLVAGRSPEFSADLVLTFDEDGDNTAGVVQDDNVVLFKANAIYVFGGDGPNALGQGSFSPPRKLAADSGAESQASIVLTRLGTIFKSVKGWYLLDRSLQVSPDIGQPIAAYKDRAVLASLFLEDRDEAVILLSGGTLLAFDLTHRIWQTRALPQEMAHMAVVGGVLHFLGKDGSLWKEDSSITRDDGKPYPLKLGTPFFKPSPLPETRVWRIGILGDLGDRDFEMRVRLYYDYNDKDVVEEHVIDTADAQLDENGALILEIVPARTRCQAVKVDLEDVDGQGENFALSSISLDVGVAKRLSRQRPARRG